MGFDRFRKTAGAAGGTSTTQATAAPATADTAAKAETAPPATAPAAAETKAVATTAAPASTAVGAFTFKAAGAVLAKIVARAESSGTGGVELFPTLIIKGGNAGGTVVPSGLTPKDVADQLPQGKQSVMGIYMCHRFAAVAWPEDFESKKEGTRPSIDCAISPNDDALVDTLLTGCENFQFCSDKANRWTVAAGGPGYLRPLVEMLVYVPKFDDVIVLRTPGLLKSVQQMAAEIGGLVNADGTIDAAPVKFSPTTAPWYDDNFYHYWGMSVVVGDEGKTAWAAYEAFKANIAARPDLAEAINEWYKCEDKPATEAVRAALAKAAGMTNPRRRRG